MRMIPDHEFLRGRDGELAVLIDAIAPETPEDPVFLVSRDGNKGYLRRAPGDVRAITGISPKFIDEVRRAAFIVFLEVRGADVVHGYDVPTAPLEEE